jgi:hypothetical protein
MISSIENNVTKLSIMKGGRKKKWQKDYYFHGVQNV